MTTMSDGLTEVVPLLVLGWADAYEARTLAHTVLGRRDPDITLRPSSLRSGALSVLCVDEASMLAVVALHTSGSVLTLTEDDVTSLDMSYVVTGPVTTELNPDTRRRWIVSVPYVEVLP